MEINKKLIRSIVFNIAETVLILLSGLALKLELKYIIMVMLVFAISRGFFGKSLHFRTWYRCLIWSLLVLTSIFVILKVDLIIAVLFAIFSAFIMTGRSNINDVYLWKNNGEPGKYDDIEEYVRYNLVNSKLLEFEENLKRRDNLLYLIYKYRFRDHLTFTQISEKLDNIENARIVEKLDQIALAIRIVCGI